MKHSQYIIHDIDEFTESSRKLVFKHFGEASSNTEVDRDNPFVIALSSSEQAELDSVLSHTEAKNIVTSLAKPQTKKIAKDTLYTINDKILMQILESLNSRLVSNILMNLTKRGIIESAYDSALDDFVFWIKNENNNTEKS